MRRHIRPRCADTPHQCPREESNLRSRFRNSMQPSSPSCTNALNRASDQRVWSLRDSFVTRRFPVLRGTHRGTVLLTPSYNALVCSSDGSGGFGVSPTNVENSPCPVFLTRPLAVCDWRRARDSWAAGALLMCRERGLMLTQGRPRKLKAHDRARVGRTAWSTTTASGRWKSGPSTTHGGRAGNAGTGERSSRSKLSTGAAVHAPPRGWRVLWSFPRSLGPARPVTMSVPSQGDIRDSAQDGPGISYEWLSATCGLLTGPRSIVLFLRCARPDRSGYG
jgi:hypothetical protein